jgi:hypothetical protein
MLDKLRDAVAYRAPIGGCHLPSARPPRRRPTRPLLHRDSARRQWSRRRAHPALEGLSWARSCGRRPRRLTPAGDCVLLMALSPVLIPGFVLPPGSLPQNSLHSGLVVGEGAVDRHDRPSVSYGRYGQVIRHERTNSARRLPFRVQVVIATYRQLFGLSAEGARLGEADDVRSAQRSRWLSCLMLLKATPAACVVTQPVSGSTASTVDPGRW